VSNRADPSNVRTVYLNEWRAGLEAEHPYREGPACLCPGTPHARDQVTILVQLGYGIKGGVREASRRSGIEAGHLVLILRAVRAWNLVLEDGTPRPIDVTEVGLLDDLTVQWLLDVLDDAWADDPPLPNGPSAPSPDGSQESAGPTQTPPSPTETPPASTST